MKINTLFLTLCSVTLINSQCATINQRKEIRELTDSEYKDYIDAALKLYIRPSTDVPSKVENLTQLHFDGGNDGRIHSRPIFLPWHRRFIREYEKALQEINPSVNLPYWDWSQDANYPHKSPVLTPLYMGGNGNSEMNFILDNGPFKFQTLLFNDNHTLSRKYSGDGGTLGAFADRGDMDTTLNYGNFSIFAKRLEYAHGTPHVNIGNGLDFGDNRSPNDPIFFLHHAFLDLIWAKWQDKYPNSNQYEGVKFNMQVSLNDLVYGYGNSTVNSTMNTRGDGYCYSYPEYPRDITPRRSSYTSNVRRSELTATKSKGEKLIETKIKGCTFEEAIGKLSKLEKKSYMLLNKKVDFIKLSPLPDYWIKMHKYDLKEVRAFEGQSNRLRELKAKLKDMPELLQTIV